MNIKLGDRVADRMTGFKGIAIAITNWLYGCTRITVQPELLKNGEVQEYKTFDEPQLILVERGAFSPIMGEKIKEDETGGPRPEPQRSEDPVR